MKNKLIALIAILSIAEIMMFPNNAVSDETSWNMVGYDWTTYDWSNWNDWRTKIKDVTNPDYVYNGIPSDWQSYTNITPACSQTTRSDECVYFQIQPAGVRQITDIMAGVFIRKIKNIKIWSGFINPTGDSCEKSPPLNYENNGGFILIFLRQCAPMCRRVR